MPEEQDAATKKPAAKKPAAKKPAPPAPAAAKAAAKPVAAKPAAKKPAAKTPAAAKPAAAEPIPAPIPAQPATTGPVSENPLHKKLGLRPESAGLVISPPEGDDNPLSPLPDSFSVAAQIGDLASSDGPFDYIHVFARDRGDLAGAFAMLRDKLAPGGSLWISWLKQSSGRNSAMFGDMNENVIRRIALVNAMVDVKVAALDRDWSALKLVRRKH